jgi:tetratricopeptide (TPR) repeat protein
MWRPILACCVLMLAATTAHAQQIHVRLNSGATFSYPIEEIRGISYSGDRIRFDRYDGTDLSWSISDVAHYHFFQRADGFDESVRAIEGVTVVKYPRPEDGPVDFDVMNRAIAKLGEQDWPGAAALLDLFIETAPQNEYGFLLRGNARRFAGDFEAAIRDYERALALNPVYFNAFINRGLSHAGLGDLEAALADFSRAIEHDPFNARGYHERGWAYLFHADDRRQALPDLDRALELDPGNTYAYIHRGILKSDDYDPVGAIEDYRAALAISPGHHWALNNLGTVATSLANMSQERALDILTTYFDFSDEFEIDPAAGNAQMNPGLRAILHNTAIRFYEQAIASEPTYGAAYGNKALSLMYMDSIDEACEIWQTAHKLGDASAAGYIRNICERRDP